MAGFQDQLHSLSSSKRQAGEAMAAAERRVAEVDRERCDAEARWQKAYRELEAAQEELDTVK
jgi:chromosome segregation ATPase